MKCYHRSCTFSFDVVDILTENASTMMSRQENKAACGREMLLDFIRANGIANDYEQIPKSVRLKRFFGFTGTAANTPQAEKEGTGRQKCQCQFDLYPDDKLKNDALAMLYLHDNKSLLLRELFLDFVQANGIISNYADIPVEERLERFFRYVAKQPSRTVRILKDKNVEVRQYYEEDRYVSSEITYTAPDGNNVHVTV